jgi:2-iminobutanoate/2-iminopropanoate deaminase
VTNEIIRTPNAPTPLGPYSQGVRAGNFLFVAGQGPIDPKTAKITATSIESQTTRTLQNIQAILEASGFSLRDVVKVSIYLRNASDFQKMNDVYKTYFPDNPPARTTVEAGFVAADMLVEIDAIAFKQ